jgi:hypothetical protein
VVKIDSGLVADVFGPVPDSVYGFRKPWVQLGFVLQKRATRMGPGLTSWPVFTENKENYLELDDTITAKNGSTQAPARFPDRFHHKPAQPWSNNKQSVNARVPKRPNRRTEEPKNRTTAPAAGRRHIMVELLPPAAPNGFLIAQAAVPYRGAIVTPITTLVRNLPDNIYPRSRYVCCPIFRSTAAGR